MIQSAVVVPTSRDYAGALQKAVSRSAGSFWSWGSRPRLYADVRHAHCTVKESQKSQAWPSTDFTTLDRFHHWTEGD